jgi:hypothetical protein
LLNDCWRNLRTIFKTPLLSLAIVATLALGFGANIAIFSVLKAVVIRGFPYRDAPRLVLVWMTNPQLGYSEFFVSSPDLKDLIAQNRSFETMGHYGFGLVNLTGSGTPEALLCAWVAPKLLSDLGAPPWRAVFFWRTKRGRSTSGPSSSVTACGSGASPHAPTLWVKRSHSTGRSIPSSA